MATYDYTIAVGETFGITYEGNSPSVECPSCLTYYIDGGELVFTGASVGNGTIRLYDSDTLIGEYSVVVGESDTPAVASITYNGKTIATMNGGQSATLKCAGKRMKGDIVVDVSELSESADPVLQEKTATENGVVVPDEGYDGLSKVTVAVAEQEECNLGALSVTENGTYNPTYEAASFAWDENTEYDGTIDVDGVSMRYKKVEQLTVPDNVTELDASQYCLTVTYPDGTAQSVPLRDYHIDAADGVYVASELAYAIVWIKDATIINAGYGASFEDNTVYVTDYLWLANSEATAGVTFTLTAPGKKIDGFSSVTVNVESESGSGGLAINGIIEQYKVNAGATVNAGDFVEFVNKWGSNNVLEDTSNVSKVSACKLGTGSVFIAYRYLADSFYHLYGVVYTFSGDTIIAGTAKFLMSGASDNRQFYRIAAVALSDNKVFVASICYNDADYYPCGIVCDVIGTEISTGTATIIGSACPYSCSISAVALTDSRVMVVSTHYGDVIYMKGRICTIVDAEITVSVENELTSATFLDNVSLVTLSSEKVFIAFRYNSGSTAYYLRGIVCHISDTEITAGSSANLYNGGTSSPALYFSDISAVALTDSKVVVFYSYLRSSIYDYHRLYAMVCTVSGTTITAGSSQYLGEETDADDYIISGLSAVALTDSKVFVAYGYVTSVHAVVCNISGTSVSVGTVASLESGRSSISGNSAVAFSDDSVFVISSGSSCVYVGATIDGTTITVNAESEGIGTYVQPATSNLHSVGVAATSGVEGETVDVYVVG